MFSVDVTLMGGPRDDQSAVVWDDINECFIAHIGNTITRWGSTGALVDTIQLIGFGDQGDEEFAPQDGVVASTRFDHRRRCGTVRGEFHVVWHTGEGRRVVGRLVRTSAAQGAVARECSSTFAVAR